MIGDFTQLFSNLFIGDNVDDDDEVEVLIADPGRLDVF
jgi:hypothetical protein